MNVLIVSEMSPPYAIGGGEVRYALLSRALVQRGHRVTWLSMRQRDSPREETREGVRHLHVGPRIDNPPVRPLHAMLRYMLSAFAHLLRNRYDVVDCQTYAPLPAVWLACLLTRTPMVATIHDIASLDTQGGVDQWFSRRDRLAGRILEKALYRIPYRRIITVSNSVKRGLVGMMGVAPGRIRVVPNAVDVEAITAVPAHPERCDLIFVGRLVPHKHPTDFLAVCDLVNQRSRAAGGPGITARIVGGGPLEADVRREIARRGLQDVVRLVGTLPDHAAVLAHIKSAQILVLPSTREGFGLVLAEAMACGTLIAAYGLSPVRETVGEALAPNLAPVGDIEGLARIVGKMLFTENSAEFQRRQGHQRLESYFSMQAFVEQVLGVYQEATCCPAAPAGELS